MQNEMPKHVAIIMDGNGRWATRKGLPKIAGHREGIASARMALDCALAWGIRFLTLYTFSTENWKRPKHEVEALFAMIEEYLEREGRSFAERGIRFRVIGRLAGLPSSTQAVLKKAMDESAANTRLQLVLALNYGARTEIADAASAIAREAAAGRLSPETVDEEAVAARLYTAGIPDPELLIRTSGEFRLSNFLLWQLSYAEIHISPKLWPDFNRDDFAAAIADYNERERRFGG